MAIKSVFTSALVALMAAGSLLPMASAASARDFDHRGSGSGKGNYSKSYKSSGNYNNYNNRNYGWRGRDRGNQYAYGGPRRHHRDHTGRNLAIGAFATILGIAIASEVNRDRRGGYGY
ncbi:MAG TPA: hypothetical protein PLD46_06025 [Hyphomicrobium sp.]|nr:hypothetical protein [Hyphomicrobium sp.]